MTTPEERLVSSMHQPIQTWTGEERRRHTRSELFDYLAEINQAVSDLRSELGDHKKMSADRHESLSAQVMGEQTIIKAFSESFPDGDFLGHRRYHELLIKRAERWDKMQTAIIEKSLAALAWSALVVGGSALWTYIQTKIGVK